MLNAKNVEKKVYIGCCDKFYPSGTIGYPLIYLLLEYKHKCENNEAKKG